MGPPSIIRFQYEGVNIVAHTHINDDNGSISISLYSANSFKLGIPTTQFSVEFQGKKQILRVNQVRRYPLTADIPIKERLFLEGYKGTHFVLDFDLNIQDAKEFTLFIPTFIINGNETTFPPIRWSLNSGVYIAPLNC